MPTHFFFPEWKHVADQTIEKYAERKEAPALLERAYRIFQALKNAQKKPETTNTEEKNFLEKETTTILGLLKDADQLFPTASPHKSVINRFQAEVGLYRQTKLCQLGIKPSSQDIQKLKQYFLSAIESDTSSDVYLAFNRFLKLELLDTEATLFTLNEIFLLLPYQKLLFSIQRNEILNYLTNLTKLANQHLSVKQEITNHIKELISLLLKTNSNSVKERDYTKLLIEPISNLFSDEEKIQFLLIAVRNRSQYAIEQLVTLYKNKNDGLKQQIIFSVLSCKTKSDFCTVLENIEKLPQKETAYIYYIIACMVASKDNSLSDLLPSDNKSLWNLLNNPKVTENTKEKWKINSSVRHTSDFSVTVSSILSKPKESDPLEFLFYSSLTMNPFLSTSVVIYCYKQNLIDETVFNSFLSVLQSIKPVDLYQINLNSLRYARIKKFFADPDKHTKEHKLQIGKEANAITSLWPTKKDLLNDLASQLLLEYDIDCLVLAFKIMKRLPDVSSLIISQTEKKYSALLLNSKLSVLEKFITENIKSFSAFPEAKNSLAIFENLKLHPKEWIDPLAETLFYSQKWQSLVSAINTDNGTIVTDLSKFRDALTKLNETGWKSEAQGALTKLAETNLQVVNDRWGKDPEEFKLSKMEETSPSPTP